MAKRYYKILAKDCNHSMMRYQDDFHFDDYESSDRSLFLEELCMFTDVKNIAFFCSCGDTIADVRVPKNAKIETITFQCGNTPVTMYKANRLKLFNFRPLWKVKTFSELMRLGANIITLDRGAMLGAVADRHLGIVKYLTEHGGDIMSALRYAVNRSHLDIVEYLIAFGAAAHTEIDYDMLSTVPCDDLDIIKLLIAHGADVNTMFSYAAEFGLFEIIQYLAEHGADIHNEDEFALRIAAKCDYLDVVKYLVERGADIHAENDEALHNAEKSECKDIVDYLKSIARES